MNLKKFEVALERTSKNLIILHCYCGPGTSKNLRLHLREPQKTPGLLGTRTSNSFQGSFTKPHNPSLLPWTGNLKNLRRHLRAPQKTPGLLGTRTSHLFQGSFNQLQKPSALMSNRNFNHPTGPTPPAQTDRGTESKSREAELPRSRLAWH